MPGKFINSPNLIGKLYKKVADFPNARPVAQDGNRAVFKGFRKVYLVVDGVVTDFFDWDIYGDQYRHVQRRAQAAWGITWPI